MSNKINERYKDDFISKLFRALGRGARPAVIKTLSKKDPKFAELVKDVEKTNAKVDAYLKSRK